MNLVIVESPTKARTLSKFLGKGYTIDASMGHIRDLPKGELGVDIEHQFLPRYIIPRDKRKKVSDLKKLAKKATQIWLATDPDREGEAIAWHLEQILTGHEKDATDPDQSGSSDASIRRVEFHEITESAIKQAFASPRQINRQLVDAQQARRILDRLVGYSISPVLWEKVKRGLSAGRVQSAALKLIVEREKEVQAFQKQEYWSIKASLETSNQDHFWADLIESAGQKIAITTEEQATIHTKALESATYQVKSVTKKELRRFPQAPFTTSTLQQTAGNKLGYSAKKTMMLAQNLYEQGLITYMRTDSVNLSTQALDQARSYIKSHFSDSYLPASPRNYTSKVKNAQEAHEAIRPTSIDLIGDSLEGDKITRDHRRLYDLIWKRTLSSQMTEAILDQTTIDINADNYLLRATGSVVKFDGWMKLFLDAKKSQSEDEEEDTPNDQQILPQLSEKDLLKLLQLLPEQHFTQPPPRYSEASLVKKLEELGIGRPSTYAPTISTLEDRLYVTKSDKRFTPTELGTTVSDFLVKNFSNIVDFSYTAEMEDSLDQISRGEKKWKDALSLYYQPLAKDVEQAKQSAEKVKIELEVTDKPCPTCGKPLVVRFGRFGKFLACSGFPDCKYTEAIDQIIDAKCPEDGGDIILRHTRKGKPFYGCKNYPNCKYATWNKPKPTEVTKSDPASGQ